MKNRIFFLSALTFFFCAALLYSCKKSGCSDIKASNYTTGATDDDGSCVFYSQVLAGNWLYVDTTTVYGTGSSYSNINTDAFRLEKLDNEKVIFRDYMEGTVATVYENYMTVNGSSSTYEISADKRTIKFNNSSEDGFGYYVKQ